MEIWYKASISMQKNIYILVLWEAIYVILHTETEILLD